MLHISVMQSFFFGKGHEPARCEKLRKETARLRSQILQYDADASLDSGGSAGRGGKGGGLETAAAAAAATAGEEPGKSNSTKKLGDYCIACELARLFEDMFSTEGAAFVSLSASVGRISVFFDVVSAQSWDTIHDQSRKRA